MSIRARTAAIGILMTVLTSGVAAVPSAAEAPSPIAVPVQYVHGELILKVLIGSHGPYAFLLDTDTNPSVIDAGLVRRLRLRTDGPAGAGSGVGSDTSTAVPLTIHDLSVGALHVATLAALSTDLTKISAHFGHHIDGALGTSFFTGRVVQISYCDGIVSFLPDAIMEPYTARFTNGDENTSSDVYVGNRRVTATFDTGDSGFGFVTRRGIRTLGLSDAARVGRAVKSYGYNGADPETSGLVPNVRIGDRAVGALAVHFVKSANDPFDINIGNRTLQHFIVTFDYQRGLLTLQLRKQHSRCSTSMR